MLAAFDRAAGRSTKQATSHNCTVDVPRPRAEHGEPLVIRSADGVASTKMARNYEKRFSGLNRFLEAKKGEYFLIVSRQFCHCSTPSTEAVKTENKRPPLVCNYDVIDNHV